MSFEDTLYCYTFLIKHPRGVKRVRARALQSEGMDLAPQPNVCLANHFSPSSITYLIFEFEKVTYLPH